jgi:hypothetical protein
VGRAIRRLNLASEQATRSKHSMRYVFEREKVTRIYTNYLHEPPEPTPASTPANEGTTTDHLLEEDWV